MCTLLISDVLFSFAEYCGTFCYPNVAQSPYLRTVGEKLLPGIDVLWTGKSNWVICLKFRVVFKTYGNTKETNPAKSHLLSIYAGWEMYMQILLIDHPVSLLGPKVVSKDIPVESIEEVSKIIRRAPVIWDNIHANDYDQKRLFLGPYKGRSTELIPRLKGVLTNPNCEFEANYVAIHTLATWYKSNMNGVRKDVVMSKYA